MWQQVIIVVGCQELLLSIVATYLGSATSTSVIRCGKPYLHGTVEGGCCTERLHKSWKDNLKEWTGQSLSSLLYIADNRSR